MFKEELSLVPHLPGCYLMHNKEGIVIYVGKSKNLKNRLSSYFQREHTGKTKMLVKEIDYFEYIVTNTEMESLLLEINLIKKYNPKYNILYRDDKSYPYIELTDEKVPRLRIIRRINVKKIKNNLFGPYPNVTAAKKVVEILNRIYPLRKCNNYEKKVCLYYHIGECLGYCEKEVPKEKIDNMKNEIISFLNGNTGVLTDRLKEKMNVYSENMEYEKALEYKELLDYINITTEKQKVDLDSTVNTDVVGYYTKDNYISIQILFIRGGKLLDRTRNIFPMITSVEEELSSYLTNFYSKNVSNPKEILVPDIIDTSSFTEIFKYKFITPIKGDKKRILDLAYDNARIYYEEEMSYIKNDDDRINDALEELKEKLHIDSANRIELFDNSNLFGNFNVSGMVVFVLGRPSKNDYRKFKITSDVNDDYGTMREVIYRRYFRVLKENLERPDLIIVDGGIGQINVAREVISSLGLSIPVAGRTNMLLGLDPIEEIAIDKKSSLFLLLTKMQDEVHNFTISYHRNLRSKGALSGVLDNIDGIGEVRKKKLLKKYKTISNMKNASLEELKEILPEKTAKEFMEFLKEK